MQTFLQWLQSEAAKISDSDIPGTSVAVQKNETVIGQIDDILIRKMFAMLKPLKDRLEKLIAAIELMSVKEDQADHDPKTCPRCKAIREVIRLTDQHKTLEDLFWGSVSSVLSDEALYSIGKAQASIGIRDGWKIVSVPGDAQGPTLIIVEHHVIPRKSDPRAN